MTYQGFMSKRNGMNCKIQPEWVEIFGINTACPCEYPCGATSAFGEPAWARHSKRILFLCTHLNAALS